MQDYVFEPINSTLSQQTLQLSTPESANIVFSPSVIFKFKSSFCDNYFLGETPVA